MAQTHAVVNAEVRKKTDLFGKAAKVSEEFDSKVAEYGNVRWYAVLAKTAVCVAALLCTARSLIAHNLSLGPSSTAGLAS